MRKLFNLAVVCTAFGLFPLDRPLEVPQQQPLSCGCQEHSDHDHFPDWITKKILYEAGQEWDESLDQMISEYSQCQIKLVWDGNKQVYVSRAGGGFVIVVLDGAL